MEKCPHVGELIAKHIKEKRYRKSAWGREHGVGAATINSYMRTPGMRTSTLYKICQTLQYNFFREIANTLPNSLSPQPETVAEKQVAELETQIKELQLKVTTLENALRLVGRG